MIRVSEMSHSFDGRQVLRDISFEVEKGAIFGFIGPNGAGKTTTLRVLSTLLTPDQGTIEINEHNTLADSRAVRRCVGFVPDSVGIYKNLSVFEYVSFFAAACGIAEATKRQEATEIALELTGMIGLSDKRCGTLSRGVRQRLALSRALVHDPKVLLLDEPASGLDPRARIELFELIKQLGSMGKTIMISSHILTELASVVTHVGVIESGRMIACGDARHISDMLGHDRVVLLRLLEPAAFRGNALEKIPGVIEVIEREPRLLAVTIQGDERVISKVVRGAIELDLSIIGVETEWTDLERIFLVATRGDLQ